MDEVASVTVIVSTALCVDLQTTMRDRQKHDVKHCGCF